MADENSEDIKDNNTDDDQHRKLTSAEERSEYFKKLEKWLQEAYAWQSVAAMFPYYVMSGQLLNPLSGVAPLPIQFTTIQNTQRTNTDASERQNNNGLRQRGPQEPPRQFQFSGAEGFEYRIPPVWKRFAAECIDSLMLFILKLTITFVAIDVFDFIDLDNLNLLETNLLFDYKMALDLTYGMLVLEIIYRVIVCIFEAFWLQYGTNGRVGGATPGKSLMGLRVVHCRSVTTLERPGDPEAVFVSPGTDLGLPLAVGRSVVKNLILTFLFPVWFVLFFFRFNRTGYDLICTSIVVEDPYRNTNNNRLHQR